MLRVLGGLWVACALLLPNYEALLGGHQHVQDGESFHHRHLFGGDHRHLGSGDARRAGTTPAEEPKPSEPAEGGSLVVPDTLTFGLEAHLDLSELRDGALASALPSQPCAPAAAERFYLPCAQRPPPNATLA